MLNTLNFDLPTELEASEPPEARGLTRDEVRLMVSYYGNNRVVHTQFRNLKDFLEAGDLLVINTSGTMNAALNATRADGTALELHLSTHLPADLWIVEVRLPGDNATRPFYDAEAGETLQLPGGAAVTLHAPYKSGRSAVILSEKTVVPREEAIVPGEKSVIPNENAVILSEAKDLSWGRAQILRFAQDDKRAKEDDSGIHSLHPYKGPTRLWIATLDLPSPLKDYLAQYGFPIRYGYVRQGWPISYYQSVYATEVGSAEMPSAGRAFTAELITQLVAHGIQIAPLILHTGVASLEDHEPPYEEYYRVPLETARLVNTARKHGKRIIAVGTTVVRALETVTDIEGTTHPGEGWTRLVVTPERGMHAVNAMLTGLHEPRASHLAMLEALAGREHLQVAYAEALRERYLWHEFGDLHLILP